MKLSRLWTVCRLDLLHYRRRPLFWFWAVIVFLCAMLLASGGMRISAGDSTTGGLQAHITSAFSVGFEAASPLGASPAAVASTSGSVLRSRGISRPNSR